MKSVIHLNDDHVIEINIDRFLSPFYLDWCDGVTKIENGKVIENRKVKSFSIKIPLNCMFSGERDAYEVVEQIVIDDVVYVIFGNHVTVKTDEYFHFYR